jgi:hypothetical protein
MELEKKLHDEISRELDILEGMEEGTESYKTLVDGLTKLTDRAIEIDKFNADVEAKAETQKFENELRLKQMKEERIDRIVKNCLTAVGIILPIGITVWGTKASFEFEKEGTVTTIMGRGFINKLLPGKK